VSFDGSGVLTIVAFTGGHPQQHERFAIQACTPRSRRLGVRLIRSLSKHAVDRQQTARPARLPVMGVGAVCAVAAVVTFALAGCSGSSPPEPAGAHNSSAFSATVVTRFTPYSAAGVLTASVAARGTGQCWTGSIVVPVADAYRCLVGNDIADPCFAPPRPSTPLTVACLPDPWSGARVVTLTQPLPVSRLIGNAARPWAVQLANGARCVASTGTVQNVHGVSLDLLCSGETAAGGLDTTKPTWHVQYGPKSGGPLTQVDVTRAWRG
jgi:hypothetical protein